MNTPNLRFLHADDGVFLAELTGLGLPVPRQGETVSLPTESGRAVHFVVDRVTWNVAAESYTPTVWLKVKR